MLIDRGARGTRKVCSLSLLVGGLETPVIAGPVVSDPRAILGALVEIIEGPLMGAVTGEVTLVELGLTWGKTMGTTAGVVAVVVVVGGLIPDLEVVVETVVEAVERANGTPGPET